MYTPKIMLDKNLFAIYHKNKKEIISLKDVFISFKFPTLSFDSFMVQYVFPNFKVDEDIVPIDSLNHMFGMERKNIDKLYDLIDCSGTFKFK